MCRKETERVILELDAEIELKLSYLFRSFQACYDFRRLRGWFKLGGIFSIDIKQAFKLIGFIYEAINGIHWFIKSQEYST